MNKFASDSNMISVASQDNTEESSIPTKKKTSDKTLDCQGLSNEGNYNTGRWSQDEHKKFIEAIFKYGNEWKKIKEFIGSRSSTQARSHAQKFFIRLKKKLFDQKLNLKKQNFDQNTISNILTCFQDCLPSKKINAEESDKLMKILVALSNENRSREEIKEKGLSEVRSSSLSEKKDQSSKKRFFIEKVQRNKGLFTKDEFKMNSVSTDLEIFNLRENLDELVFLRRTKRRNKFRLNKKRREENQLQRIQELQNNLANHRAENVIINNDKRVYAPDQLIYFEKYHVEKPKTSSNQSQGVFEDMRRYYQQLHSRKTVGVGYCEGNEYSIDELDVEMMFSEENPYYTHNKIDINHDNI